MQPNIREHIMDSTITTYIDKYNGTKTNTNDNFFNFWNTNLNTTDQNQVNKPSYRYHFANKELHISYFVILCIVHQDVKTYCFAYMSKDESSHFLQ